MTIQVTRIIYGDYVVTSNSTLNPGQLLKFNPSQIIGYVSKYIKNGLYLVKATNPQVSDTEAVLYSWWTLQQPPSAAACVGKVFFSPATTACQLLTQIITNKEMTPGSLGWDLWYCPDQEHPWLHVAKGNDLDNPGYCKFLSENAKWPSGRYLLKVTLFHKTCLVPLGSGSYEWLESLNTSELSCQNILL